MLTYGRRRKARIEERLTHEQRLLMRFFAEIDKETDPNDANSGIVQHAYVCMLTYADVC